ncbi:hypothetical protein LTR91_022635 [Friedmanniomyces endolithicus]|uniref:Glutathione S-transferase 2 n=1 Tax=Friedmanniomyces endolithicus TaxID=329885 RepID=A0AAN6K460_9PEZI|nr:hypothetical protein LTR01_008743 [Friedmanniomyces endolithicus]KAK0823264.1 hypothetical protein LTR73_008638 [Friedmanniomyces endolithicus]KAK0894257.1 hypothetical protein LTR57_023609 [Friedmanniomyces endolithicus]KAK0955589.1 hypothetical protein LTS01_023277 [Friedmanniomyces endolithicus]KAK0955914.1 hypothetical protein LTR91_022635 [Friedmanniomyces endolithicus]
MSSLKTIKLYNHGGGPNPPKVAIIVEELGIPYESTYPGPSAIKQEPYISLNPNGRLPAIEDPNTGLVLWESGAIVQYLVEQYDKDAKLRYTTFAEKWQQEAWKIFQVSGQGPYFWQLMWFKFRSEKLPSAVDRYTNEAKRVLGVIDAHLKKTNKPYLVGDKVCFADLMFVTWDHVLPFALGEDDMKDFETNMPHAFARWQKLEGRESVKKVYADVEKHKAAGAKH